MGHRCAPLLAVAAALVVGVPPASAAELSNETTLTRSAHAFRPSPIYREASSASRAVGQLRFFTEDDFPEIYLVLRNKTDALDREWVQIRVPKRPNGTIGWVLREALGGYAVSHQQLTVNRKTFRAVLRDNGKVIWRAPVGVGKPGTITPAGHFYVREKFRVKNSPLYGTRLIGTSAYSPTLTDWPGGGVVGIHGTSEPELIPGRPSHGCIRVKNPDVEKLWAKIKLGTPILVR